MLTNFEVVTVDRSACSAVCLGHEELEGVGLSLLFWCGIKFYAIFYESSCHCHACTPYLTDKARYSQLDL